MNIQHVQVTSPAELRRLLAECITGVMEGRVNVSQANAITGLSIEIHKSQRQEWDQRVYMAENLTYNQAKIVRHVLGDEEEELKLLEDNNNGLDKDEK